MMKRLLCVLLCVSCSVRLAWASTYTFYNTGSSQITAFSVVNCYYNGQWESPSYVGGTIAVGGNVVVNLGSVTTGGWIQAGYTCGGTGYNTGYGVLTISVGSNGSDNIGCGPTNCPCPAFPGCSTNYVRMRVQNNASEARTFQLFWGSAGEGNQITTPCNQFFSGGVGGSFGGSGTIPAGQVGTFTIAQCQNTNPVIIAEMEGNYGVAFDNQGNCWTSCGGGQVPGCYYRTLGTNEYSISQNPGVPVNPVTTGVSTPTAGGGFGNGSTNGIGFGTAAASDTNLTDQILMNGFQALYQQGGIMSQELQTMLARGGLGTTNGASWTTSGSGGTGTNGGGGVTVNLTNVVDLSSLTNLLGQILGADSNGFAADVAALSVLTNMVAGGTNYLAAGTNLLSSLTNSMTGASNLLSGMSNLLSDTFSNQAPWISNAIVGWGIYSNAVLDTNALAQTRDHYVGPIRDAAQAQQDGFSLGVANGDSGAYEADSGITLLSFVDGGTTYSLDLDPMHDPALLEIWSLVKGVLWWWVTLMYYVFCIKTSMRAATEVLVVQQMGKPSFTIMGNDVGGAATPVFVVLIMTAIAAVGQILVSWVSGAGASYMGSIRADPLIGHPGLATAIAWFNAVVPWQYAFGLVLTGLAFRWQIFGIYTVSAATIKLCVR